MSCPAVRKVMLGALGLVCVIAVVLGIVRERTLFIAQRPFDGNVWQSAAALEHDRYSKATLRQEMIRDLVTNVLPGTPRTSIEELLGHSATRSMMRRTRPDDFRRQEKDDFGRWKPLVPTGDGWAFDLYDWDLIYEIGPERIFIWDHRGVAFSPDNEWLIVRLDANGVFESWFIVGSSRWPEIVADPGRKSYRPKR